MLVGIDDTDSPKGMCTTYLATLLVKKLRVSELPKLIRLNPNIPYKTRGNGAVSFKIEDNEKTKKEVIKYVKKYAHFSDPKTNPGIAFVPHLNETKKKTLSKFYRKTLREIVEIDEAEKVASTIGAKLIKFKNGRGIIGALAACGAILEDKTYELISYRTEENFGKRRRIDVESVYRMNERFYPKCFDNVDLDVNQVLITPRGCDPVFCGIRGETPDVLEDAWNMVKPLEEIKLTQLFETNQATDAHLFAKKIAYVRQYDCVILRGVVSTKSEYSTGGHVFFKMKDETGEITCSAFRQTRSLRKVVSSLIPGDKLMVCGGIGKHKNTVNIEKIKIEKLAVNSTYVNPSCHGRRMTSLGKNKGFRCRVCSKKFPHKRKIKSILPRELSLGLYESPPSARRHLSKPLIRLNPK
jgi:tRNA(Ile2)-agmatinylcytidine synthase